MNGEGRFTSGRLEAIVRCGLFAVLIPGIIIRGLFYYDIINRLFFCRSSDFFNFFHKVSNLPPGDDSDGMMFLIFPIIKYFAISRIFYGMKLDGINQ